VGKVSDSEIFDRENKALGLSHNNMLLFPPTTGSFFFSVSRTTKKCDFKAPRAGLEQEDRLRKQHPKSI